MKIENFITVISENITNTNPSSKRPVFGCQFSVQVFGGTSSGSGAVEVLVEVSNYPNPTSDAHWVTAGIISLTLSTSVIGDALAVLVPYKHVRTRATSISGTGASYSSYLCAG